MFDDVQIEETAEFRLYETEQEYWEEYDRIKTETAGMSYENYDLPF